MKAKSTTTTPTICPTGIAGLDDVLAGGLPADCFYLVQGDPGAGKTTLALQFLLEGLRRGERVFYITLSETTAELERFNQRMVGRELRMVELKREVNDLCARLGQPAVYPAELTQELAALNKEQQP